MAFCKNCGTELKEGAVFCKNCGLKIGDKIQPSNTSAGYIYGKMPEHSDGEMANIISGKLNDGKDFAIGKSKEAAEKIKEWAPEAKYKTKTGLQVAVDKIKNEKKYRIAIGISAIIIVVVIILLLLLNSMSKKIDLYDCFSIEFSGYDGSGYANVYLDDEKLFQEVQDVLGKKKMDTLSIYDIENCISYELSQYENLSNGDKVILNVTCDNELAKQYKVKFADGIYNYTVNGLGMLEEIDPFEGLEVYFEGISPNMSLYYEYDGQEEFLSGGMFFADKYNGISLGDTITIELDYDEEDITQYGYRFTQTSKEYTCTDGEAYLTDVSQISDETWEGLKNEAQDCIKSFFASNSQYISYTDLNYKGCYLLLPKDMEEYENVVYIVYKSKVSSLELQDGNIPYFASTSVWMPIGFENIIVQTDGSLSYDLLSEDILGSTDLPYDGGWENVPGYLKQKSMFNELIASELVDYTYVISGDLKDLEGADSSEDNSDISGNEEYILPTSNSEYITEEDIAALSVQELRLARNEIYARHGYIFQDEELREYFSGKSWYEGTTESVEDAELNEFEIANRDLIVEMEGSLQ